MVYILMATPIMNTPQLDSVSEGDCFKVRERDEKKERSMDLCVCFSNCSWVVVNH